MDSEHGSKEATDGQDSGGQDFGRVHQEAESVHHKGDLIRLYVDYVVSHESRPKSLAQFVSRVGMKEDRFYQFFSSLKSLEKATITTFFEITVARLEAEETFQQYTAREKLLAFYFAFFERLRSYRGYLAVLTRIDGPCGLFACLAPVNVLPIVKPLRSLFIKFVSQLIDQAQSEGEIAWRPLIPRTYPEFAWLQFLAVLKFWQSDESEGFERTDAFIEKIVTLGCDLVQPGLIESTLDLGRFVLSGRSR